ncbi:hypothetical protein [Bradyrhizobium erythrophlei]|uniref:hypothetical protein n=1 Tax=Bradyrhizobium erythrophlei TaxID=1437360 RepID=UPI00115FA3D8|nr:hypothetical protein [Bradyrhizobium erythrophlei]
MRKLIGGVNGEPTFPQGSAAPADRVYHFIDLRIFTIDSGIGAKQWSSHGGLRHVMKALALDNAAAVILCGLVLPCDSLAGPTLSRMPATSTTAMITLQSRAERCHERGSYVVPNWLLDVVARCKSAIRPSQQKLSASLRIVWVFIGFNKLTDRERCHELAPRVRGLAIRARYGSAAAFVTAVGVKWFKSKFSGRPMDCRYFLITAGSNSMIRFRAPRKFRVDDEERRAIRKRGPNDEDELFSGSTATRRPTSYAGHHSSANARRPGASARR